VECVDGVSGVDGVTEEALTLDAKENGGDATGGGGGGDPVTGATPLRSQQTVVCVNAS
jgi:hypothetical protein